MWVDAHVAELLFYGRIVCVVSGMFFLCLGCYFSHVISYLLMFIAFSILPNCRRAFSFAVLIFDSVMQRRSILPYASLYIASRSASLHFPDSMKAFVRASSMKSLSSSSIGGRVSTMLSPFVLSNEDLSCACLCQGSFCRSRFLPVRHR